MNDRQQEPELHALFEAQRKRDASDAPAFAEMMSTARAEAGSAAETVAAAAPARPPRLHMRWRREWAGLAAAAAIAALIVIPRMRSGDDAFEEAVRAFHEDPALSAWQSPTDGLLNLPGDGLLSTIPDVGIETQ